ncbi:MAG: DUF4973 domain-containing protein [Dysgonomonas sp.]
MKKIYSLLSLLAVLICFSSCNDEWKDEQFERFVSFKATIGEGGVSHIYVRYKQNENTAFQLPLIVSGSTTNDKDMTVHVALDPDTLDVLNYERFQAREDYYYKVLDSKYYSIPETVEVKAGENTALMNVDFSLQGIDLVEKLVLPLTIVDNPSYNYVANPRKHYKKALLRIHPFNDYSGTYSSTALKVHLGDNQSLYMTETRSYVVDENTVFFYAGTVNEDRADRGNYKIKAHFENGIVTFTSDNPSIKFEAKTATYSIKEMMDETRPYLLHRYITINNIDYKFTDYTMAPGTEIVFYAQGSLILERKLNTQIPDEDQSIEW